jgi:hypothetical protein
MHAPPATTVVTATEERIGIIRETTLPFSYENGLIIIRVVMQGMLPLRMVLDTGAEMSTITYQEIAEALGLERVRSLQLVGVDMQTVFTADLVRGVDLILGELYLPGREMVVTHDDLLNQSAHMGLPLHGIVGADILSQFVVTLDFRRKQVHLLDPQRYRPPRGVETLPLELHRHKPYITLPTSFAAGEEAVPLKYLLDTGAALEALLISDRHPAIPTADHSHQGILGLGLGGFIFGARGHIHRLELGNLALSDFTTGIQRLDPLADTNHLQGRHGILGTAVLEQFELTLDYARRELHLRPNTAFRRGLHPDRSGLYLLAGGRDFSQIVVHDVWAGSPAAAAGILPGDRLRRINGWPLWAIGLDGAARRLQKKPGTDIRLTLTRDDTWLKKQFRLAEY